MMKTRMMRVGLALLLGSAAGLAAGCGSRRGEVSPETGAQIAQQNSMAELGELLRLRKADTGTPPAKAADFARYEMGFPEGYRKVKAGDVVLFFGAPIVDGDTSHVLAYEKQTPESGGYVLMSDATTVKKMSPEEFKSAPKAGTAPDAPKK